jgi:hypothetical protein
MDLDVVGKFKSRNLDRPVIFSGEDRSGLEGTGVERNEKEGTELERKGKAAQRSFSLSGPFAVKP